MSSLAVAFPGQGAQKVGMAKNLKDQIDLFEEASELLGYDLFQLIEEGPEDKLTQTKYAQPALLVTTYATWRELSHMYQPDFILGHSLGEVTALVVSGSLSFADGVRLVQRRGELMEEASQIGGAMVAIIGLDEQTIQQLCTDARGWGWVQIANFNAPGQIVASGKTRAIEDLAERASQAGAKKVVPLRVSGPFHSQLMEPAATEFSKFVASVPIGAPNLPVVSNITSQALTEAETIRSELVQQLISPVNWVENILFLESQGVAEVVEVSPSPILTSLGRRITRNLKFTLAKPKGDVVA